MVVKEENPFPYLCVSFVYLILLIWTKIELCWGIIKVRCLNYLLEKIHFIAFILKMLQYEISQDRKVQINYCLCSTLKSPEEKLDKCLIPDRTAVTRCINAEVNVTVSQITLA